jgi:multicomponent K+:H+ antiporter subunit D
VISSHAIVWPVVLPLVVGALLLLVEKSGSARAHRIAAGLSVAAIVLLLLIAAHLVVHANSGTVEVYLLANWRAPFGIALALDRLSALMLLLTAIVALGAVLYALGGDAQRSPHFHAFLQFQLMGVNGAFLTADLFNLFVFFEVLLIASYGLLLHGAGAARLKASIHYVSFNLAGSALFLIAVATLYGMTGTLNMADLAIKVPQLPASNQTLTQSAALMLLVVFAIKAALLPLYFWLPNTYGAATAPVAAFFAVMTKVGVYAIARVYLLVFSAQTEPTGLGWQQLLSVLSMVTIVLAALGALAARQLRGLVAYAVIASAATLLLALGLAQPGTVAAGLFYLPATTLTAALMFLIADRIAAARTPLRDALEPAAFAMQPVTLVAVLFFATATAMAGVPPLAGFLGKALLLQSAWHTPQALYVWVVVLSGSLLLMVALARAGSVLFWKTGVTTTTVSKASPSESSNVSPSDNPIATTHAAHRAALLWLAAGVVACAVFAGPLYGYTQAAAAQLFERSSYIQAVLGKQSAPPAWDIRKEMRDRIERGGEK